MGLSEILIRCNLQRDHDHCEGHEVDRYVEERVGPVEQDYTRHRCCDRQHEANREDEQVGAFEFGHYSQVRQETLRGLLNRLLDIEEVDRVLVEIRGPVFLD